MTTETEPEAIEQSIYPMHVSTSPDTYFDPTTNHSNRAVYTCEKCGTKHRGWEPDECIECGHEVLDWAFQYPPQGRHG